MHETTIKEILEFLVGKEHLAGDALTKFLGWPPDVFAVAAHLLRESGGYIHVVREHPGLAGTAGDWEREVEQVAGQWQEEATQAPPAVVELWSRLVSLQDTPVREIGRPQGEPSRELWRILVRLMAFSDAASRGFGMWLDGDYQKTQPPQAIKGPGSSDKKEVDLAMIRKAAIQLFDCFTGSRKPSGATERLPATLCLHIPASKLTVLPKMHTPQSGITIRSLSHHLSLMTGADVTPHWLDVKSAGDSTPHGGQELSSLNLLILPWPDVVYPSQFKAVKNAEDFGFPLLTDKNRFFQYAPMMQGDENRSRFKQKLQHLCELASERVGPVDGVILPEMALSGGDIELFSEVLLPKIRFFVAGACEPPRPRGAGQGGKPGRNYAAIHIRRDQESVVKLDQHKHHRWFLDADQIRRYGLGASLHTQKRWWELISLEERSLYFITLSPYICFSVLICEDLARPDPAGDLIRSVGPNLIIALLADGPQLASRWAARYATVLADDPGSSVLTLTSLGMAGLSRTADQTSASRTVALWRDSVTGTRQIDLPQNANALVLSLTCTKVEEFTADGRTDGGHTGHLTLSGVFPLLSTI